MAPFHGCVSPNSRNLVQKQTTLNKQVLTNVKKVTLNENVRFTNYASEIRLADSIEFATNRKNDNSHNFPT